MTEQTPSRCPVCRGDTALHNPLWREWWRRHDRMRAVWETSHLGRDWFASSQLRALEHELPSASEPEELPCATCDGEGIGDLVHDGVSDAAEALARAARHLPAWRGSERGDLCSGRDALEALRQTKHAVTAAAARLHSELQLAELTRQLRTEVCDATREAT